MSAPVPAKHRPVMLAEVIAALGPKDGGHYIDGTFGGGGYSRAILEAADCKVLGIDRDPEAIARGQALVKQFEGRLTLVEGEFSRMDTLAGSSDGIVLDLGVSSFQFDTPARGFSLMVASPASSEGTRAWFTRRPGETRPHPRRRGGRGWCVRAVLQFRQAIQSGVPSPSQANRTGFACLRGQRRA